MLTADRPTIMNAVGWKWNGKVAVRGRKEPFFYFWVRLGCGYSLFLPLFFFLCLSFSIFLWVCFISWLMSHFIIYSCIYSLLIVFFLPPICLFSLSIIVQCLKSHFPSCFHQCIALFLIFSLFLSTNPPKWRSIRLGIKSSMVGHFWRNSFVPAGNDSRTLLHFSMERARPSFPSA